MFLKNTSLQYTEESVLHNIIHRVPERNNIVVYLLLIGPTFSQTKWFPIQDTVARAETTEGYISQAMERGDKVR